MRSASASLALGAALMLSAFGLAAPADVPTFAKDTTISADGTRHIDLWLDRDTTLAGIETLEAPADAFVALTGPATAFVYILAGFGTTFTDVELPAGPYRVTFVPSSPARMRVVVHMTGLEGAAEFTAVEPSTATFAPLARADPAAPVPFSSFHFSGSAPMERKGVVGFFLWKDYPRLLVTAGQTPHYEFRLRGPDGIVDCLSIIGGTGMLFVGLKVWSLSAAFYPHAPPGPLQLEIYAHSVETPVYPEAFGLWVPRAPDDPSGEPPVPTKPLAPWDNGVVDEDAACMSTWRFAA